MVEKLVNVRLNTFSLIRHSFIHELMDEWLAKNVTSVITTKDWLNIIKVYYYAAIETYEQQSEYNQQNQRELLSNLINKNSNNNNYNLNENFNIKNLHNEALITKPKKVGLKNKV